MLANNHIRIRQTKDGLIAYNINDIYIGRSLENYGEYSALEQELFTQLIQPNNMVIDAGANIGTHTLVMSKAVGPRGSVLAFEPQQTNYYLLCANLAINEITNTQALSTSLGHINGHSYIERVDQTKTGNFGGPGLTDESGVKVDMITVDSLNLPACDFMKLDVQGSESIVLTGADQTIKKFYPILYVENDQQRRSPALIRQLQALGYILYWHLPPLFNPNNFDKNPKNIFDNIVSINLLCVHHSDGRRLQGFPPVENPDHWPLRIPQD